jgi:hypothetical protein
MLTAADERHDYNQHDDHGGDDREHLHPAWGSGALGLGGWSRLSRVVLLGRGGGPLRATD